MIFPEREIQHGSSCDILREYGAQHVCLLRPVSQQATGSFNHNFEQETAMGKGDNSKKNDKKNKKAKKDAKKPEIKSILNVKK